MNIVSLSFILIPVIYGSTVRGLPSSSNNKLNVQMAAAFSAIQGFLCVDKVVT